MSSTSTPSSSGGPLPPAAPPTRWSLSIFTRQPASLPLLESDPSLPHAIVFVPGLTDTFGTCPYLDRLAHGVAPLGFQVVQLQLSSSLAGFGFCSLEGDAQEMALAVSWLRKERGTQKVILMGHSTGCQDAMAYLSHPAGSRGRGDAAVVDAAVLQAPVSDRESWESMYRGKDEAQAQTDDEDRKHSMKPLQLLALATRLVQEGKGAQLLPRNVPLVQPPTGSPSEEPTPQRGNENAIWDSPMTAYRYWSLYAKGGHDDFFSTSDLSAAQIHDVWKRASHGLPQRGTGYILALVGGDDEYIPRPSITPQTIVASWHGALDDDGGDAETKKKVRFEVLDGANHKVDKPEAQVLLVAKVRQLIKALGVAPTTGARKAMPPPPPALLSKGIPAWQLDDAPKDTLATPLVITTTTTTTTTTSNSDESLDSSASHATQSSVSTDAGVGAGSSSDVPSATASASASASAGASVPPHPASFDALVELIASGRTDEIEGIRDIPLVINEGAPSESKMPAARKPWEGAGAGAHLEQEQASASAVSKEGKAEADGATMPA